MGTGAGNAAGHRPAMTNARHRSRHGDLGRGTALTALGYARPSALGRKRFPFFHGSARH